MTIKLLHGDCLERMSEIEDGSVDMVMCDPPYGTTACKWDSVIPLEPMWVHLKRVVKPNGAIVLMASQPFTTTLIASNMKMFKYCWVWQKNFGSNFLTASKRPFKEHEDVCMFYEAQPTYKPIMEPRSEAGKAFISHCRYLRRESDHDNLGPMTTTQDPNWRLPGSVRTYSGEHGLHPTQKPVALMAYLIKTYTDEGDTVLDFAMGSGTTGVACKQLRRNFIGIELDEGYFKIASNRIEGIDPLPRDLFPQSHDTTQAPATGTFKGF